MSDAITTFFRAWSETDPTARRALIDDSFAPGGIYSDPRSGARLDDHGAISDYVGMFSANAPGWTASVEKSDDVNGYHRAIIAFGGKGPDGTEMVQHGSYFATLDDGGKLTLLAGFAGTGA
ncbi:molecular chaperone GroEL [Octadecabacter sp. R77987]|uniref:molecular chaperone GroEL n=1 Tax=Octadecabacter sp. R77987 TaxID=3093874 RepID=UPI00366AE4C5